VRQNEAEYELLAGDPLELLHHGETLTIEHGPPEKRPVRSAAHVPRAEQPPSRSPPRRHREH